MKLNEIKEAVDLGKTVCWSNQLYEVVKGKAGYFIHCTSNDYYIGLTHTDNITMNGEEEDFFIKVTE